MAIRVRGEMIDREVRVPPHHLRAFPRELELIERVIERCDF
jgi:hypothetical protein